jgi:hypothetical protein
LPGWVGEKVGEQLVDALGRVVMHDVMQSLVADLGVALTNLGLLSNDRNGCTIS